MWRRRGFVRETTRALCTSVPLRDKLAACGAVSLDKDELINAAKLKRLGYTFVQGQDYMHAGQTTSWVRGFQDAGNANYHSYLTMVWPEHGLGEEKAGDCIEAVLGICWLADEANVTVENRERLRQMAS